MVSVLNREPMGMKRLPAQFWQGRIRVSVLNREPMGMKPTPGSTETDRHHTVSVLNREPMGMKQGMALGVAIPTHEFQCSTASRWG